MTQKSSDLSLQSNEDQLKAFAIWDPIKKRGSDLVFDAIFFDPLSDRARDEKIMEIGIKRLTLNHFSF